MVSTQMFGLTVPISEALDALLDKGHITTDEDGMMYKAIGKQGRTTYTFVSDD